MENKIAPTESPSPAFLTAAFARFEEASHRLEERYRLLRDESERLRIELQKKETEVRKAEKMAVLGQTAAALAHEIRNPLGAIKLFMSLLREDVTEMPEALKLVDEVGRSITTLDRVISNVLQFAKDRECILAPTNINNIIADEVALFKKLDRDGGVRFELKLCEWSFVLANDGLLRQMLTNLFLNAAQAMSYNGKIIISTKESSNTTERFLELTVADNGPGISAEILPRLFEPFVTGRSEGTGLGLAVVKKTVEQHNGIIEAKNNNGAEFKISLPISRRGL